MNHAGTETTAALLTEGIKRLRASDGQTARLDAELLLADAIGVSRTAILAHPDAPVGPGAAAAYRAGIARREAGEPVAYIRGLKEFHGLAFHVDPRALIPRPETETLVDLGIAEVMRRLTAAPRPGADRLRVVDVGTGAGPVAVSLAVALRTKRALGEVDILATDISPDALGVARENAVGHAVADVVVLVAADLLPDQDPDVSRPFDVVLANLPYVRRDAMGRLPRATTFEPAVALDGGEDGLAVIQRLLARLPERLAPDGVALLEIGADQGGAIRWAAEAILPGWPCAVEPDLAGLPRVARIGRTGRA